MEEPHFFLHPSPNLNSGLDDMIIRELNGKKPQFGKDCFLAENAAIIGDVVMGDQCSIWYNANKNLPLDLRDRFLDETISGYPDRKRLFRACEYFFHHPNPSLRFARSLDRRFRSRANKPTSKYNVSKALLEKLKKI